MYSFLIPTPEPSILKFLNFKISKFKIEHARMFIEEECSGLQVFPLFETVLSAQP